MAVDEAGGYDLARGFETMISGNKAIERAIRDLQITLVTALSVNKDRSLDPNRYQQFTQSANQVWNMVGATQTAAKGAGSMSGSEIELRAGQSIGSNPGSADSTTVSAPGGGGSGGTPKAPQTPGNAQGVPGGSGGGLMEGLVKATPFSGFVTKPLDEIRSQRDKNARYQSIVGGDNVGGFGERIHEGIYSLSTRGVLSAEESSQATMGVTAMGYNDDAGKGYGNGYGRQDMLNYIYHKKTSAGQGVEESLQQLDAFTKTPTANLEQFSAALKQVGDAAADAGVNAKLGRDMFMKSYGAATAAGFGLGSTNFAAQASGTYTQFGTAFANNVDTSGMTNDGVLRMQAAQMGISKVDLMIDINKGGNLGIEAAQAGTKMLIDMFPPQVVAWAKQQIAANPEMSEAEKEQLARQIWARSGYDDQTILAAATSFTGKTYTSVNDVMREIVETLSGNGIGTLKRYKSTGTSEDYESLGTTTTGPSGVQKAAGFGLSALTGVPGIGLAAGVAGAAVGAGETTTTTTATSAAYNKYVEEHGGAGVGQVGAFEQILKRLGAEGDAQDTQEIKIGGKTMSLRDALADDKAMNKIAQGKGRLVGGEFDGQTVGQVTSEAEESGDNETSATEGVQQVAISLTDEAKRWFAANPGVEAAAADSGFPLSSLNPFD